VLRSHGEDTPRAVYDQPLQVPIAQISAGQYVTDADTGANAINRLMIRFHVALIGSAVPMAFDQVRHQLTIPLIYTLADSPSLVRGYAWVGIIRRSGKAQAAG
jgi:hypothetical protein